MQNNKDNWDALEYARHSTGQLRWARGLIAKLKLRGSETLLDIGCGEGKITAQIAQLLKAGRVIGIDASANMIALAQQSFPKISYPNLSFVHMDAQQISLYELFDVAFSNATLHWIHDHMAVLKGVRQHLKGGGRILFQMGGEGNAVDLIQVLDEIMTEAEWQHYFQEFQFPYAFYGIDVYETWLPQTDFKPYRIELIPKDMQHFGMEGFKGWLRTTWFPYTNQVPLDLRESFLEAVLNRYVGLHPIDHNGRVHIQMVRLEVEATAI